MNTPDEKARLTAYAEWMGTHAYPATIEDAFNGGWAALLAAQQEALDRQAQQELEAHEAEKWERLQEKL